MKTVAISFIVHDDFSHIHAALNSLYASTKSCFEVYVTINTTSHDSEIERLSRAFPDITIVVNDKPRGFAANHNHVMQITQTPFLALLNDDIEIQPGTLDVLISVLQSDSAIGLVGPVIQNPDGTPQLSVFSDPTLPRTIYKISGVGSLTPHGGLVRQILQQLGIAQRLSAESLKSDFSRRDVPVIVGVCMVTRRDVYQFVGGMDEDTRVYGEEYGWHWRIRQAGWRVVFVPDVVITHYNVRQSLTGWKLAEHRKSILNYYLRYKPHWQAIVVRSFIVACHSLWAALNLPFSRQQAHQHWLAVQIGLLWRPKG